MSDASAPLLPLFHEMRNGYGESPAPIRLLGINCRSRVVESHFSCLSRVVGSGLKNQLSESGGWESLDTG